jgi:hypothetical protein
LFVKLNESLLHDIDLIQARAPSCDFIAYFRFPKILRRAGLHSLQRFVREFERKPLTYARAWLCRCTLWDAVLDTHLQSESLQQMG